MRYKAVVCPHCGRASAVKAEAKTHRCPYCGRVFSTDKALVLGMGSSKTVREYVINYNERL